jgi:pimeloyl-ACP methyl ester carboxylesterase
MGCSGGRDRHEPVRGVRWVEFHYHEAGRGYPLVLVHGSGPAADGWSTFRPVIPGLSEGLRVLAVDMPGWGGSTPVLFDGARQVGDSRH